MTLPRDTEYPSKHPRITIIRLLSQCFCVSNVSSFGQQNKSISDHCFGFTLVFSILFANSKGIYNLHPLSTTGRL